MTKTAHGPSPLRLALALAIVATCLLGGVWASRGEARVSSERTRASSELEKASIELVGTASEQGWTPISEKVGVSSEQARVSVELVGRSSEQVGTPSSEKVGGSSDQAKASVQLVGRSSEQVVTPSSEKVGGSSEQGWTPINEKLMVSSEESGIASEQVRATSELARAPSIHVGASSNKKGVDNDQEAVEKSRQEGVTSGQTEVTSERTETEETASDVISGALSTCRGRDDAFSCTAREVVGRLRRSGGVQLFDGVSVRWTDRPTNDSDHMLSVDFRRLARSLRELGSSSADGARKWFGGFAPAAAAGKSSFLAGFGLGFLTFALKKLLLPFFIGAQIVKSVLIAMFLPSILGGLGKIVGKGVSTIASSSGSSRPSGGGGAGGDVDDFDFKDNMGFDSEASMSEPASFTYPEPAFSGVTYNTGGLPAGTLPASSLYAGTNSATRNPASAASNKVSYVSPANTHHYGSYYTRYSVPKQDYKVFHNIPSSSMLLTNYDPFYSPLLSRLDSVFKQLGYDTEACRERLVCSMYSNPAKFAPYSNLVSAQLSRELNELRKPSSDNPEILRFFRYMKAAKDGQDGQDCFKLHPSCGPVEAASASPPLVKTFNDINKLVQARRLAAR